MSFLTDILGGAFDLLLPNICCACGAGDVSLQGLCHECNLKLLNLVAVPYCCRCGVSLGPNVKTYQEGCGRCPSTLPRFERVVRLGAYADPLRGIVRGLKYHRREAVRKRLGDMLAAAVGASCDREMDLVLSVPMHWRRRLTRGYDHARVIARELARRLALPLGDELVKVRDTQPQAHLPRTGRIQNLRDAFSVLHKSTISGAHVLLVDDVTTTGATANEAARTLLDAGAAGVTLAVLAKADPPKAYAEHTGQP